MSLTYLLATTTTRNPALARGLNVGLRSLLSSSCVVVNRPPSRVLLHARSEIIGQGRVLQRTFLTLADYDNNKRSSTIGSCVSKFSSSSSAMAPTTTQPTDPKAAAEKLIRAHQVVVFSKTTCPFCDNVKAVFKEMGLEHKVKYVELDLMEGEEGKRLQEAVGEMSGLKTVPNVYIGGRHLGGSDDLGKAKTSGKLAGMLTLTEEDRHPYDYDIVVIGGGSGGLSASKEAARLGRKVAVCDFVKPSPPGTTWGLGGTCVNVGCIPKKLMHQASLLGESRKDSASYGWKETNGEDDKVDWAKMVEGIQNHIGSLNWGYRVALREKSVTYLNEYASFVDEHTIKTVNKKGKEGKVTSKCFILATGGRPKYPDDVPGAVEFGITSDDLFSLPYNPGKTLLVGASYISLECAGFLAGIGVPSTVMVRSILLRGFDQQMATKAGEYMETAGGVNFIRECVPVSLERTEEGKPGKIRVKAKYEDGTAYEDWFNTVVFAVGREAETRKINVEAVGVKLNPSNGKVIHDDHERTTCPTVFAIGDVLDGKPELTPVAIRAGILLARRLCRMGDVLTDYVNVPTTVFTPLEYGCVGLSEEDAVAKHGDEQIEVYHKSFWPLEWTLPKREENSCYAKLVCLKSDKEKKGEKVIGLHYLGPNAGEVTQGFAGMMVMGAVKDDFDRLVGIHPTSAEVFTMMDITKRSGVSAEAAGC